MNLIDLSTSPLPDAISIPESHVHCMVCGECESLGLRFHANGKAVEAQFQARSKWQGYRGVLHGGMVSTLLDAAMTHCLFSRGIEAVTADLNVRFHRPAPCGALLVLSARVRNERHHLYFLSAELRSPTALLASAEARFMRRKS